MPAPLNRTPESHTREIRKAYPGYSCLTVGKSKAKFTYKHECGHVFDMTVDCFFGSRCPCSQCRPSNNITDSAYRKRLKSYGVKPLASYTDGRLRMDYLYVECGHKHNKLAGDIWLGRIPRCPVCHPTKLWHTFEAAGRLFRTRSLVERDFVFYLLEKGVPVDKIEYEPKLYVPYRNPVTGKMSRYHPDFRIQGTIVEVKDLASLGLQDYHWQPKHEALIVNRAKAKAAVSSFGDYRIYVRKRNGDFDRIRRI